MCKPFRPLTALGGGRECRKVVMFLRQALYIISVSKFSFYFVLFRHVPETSLARRPRFSDETIDVTLIILTPFRSYKYRVIYRIDHQLRKVFRRFTCTNYTKLVAAVGLLEIRRKEEQTRLLKRTPSLLSNATVKRRRRRVEEDRKRRWLIHRPQWRQRSTITIEFGVQRSCRCSLAEKTEIRSQHVC